MANYRLDIDLSKFRNSCVMELKRGNEPVQCLIIPMEDNNLRVHNNGGIYANFNVSEMQKSNNYGATHYIKRFLTKDEYKALSDEEKKNQPFFGSLKPADVKSNNNNNNNKGRNGNGTSQNSYVPQQESQFGGSSIDADSLPF